MSTLTIDPNVTGKGIFESTIAWLPKDDASDNYVGGVFTPKAIEFSANEANQFQSFFEFSKQLAKVGAGAFAGINKTGGSLAAGTPVALSNLNSASHLPTFIVADPALGIPALGILIDAVANNAAGVAYVGGAKGILTTGLNQGAVTIGVPVYLTAGGGVSITPDYSLLFTQVVGYTYDQLNPGNMYAVIQAPIPNIQQQTGLYLFPEVDLKTNATASLAVGSKSLSINEVGIILSTVAGTITGQPTVEWGIVGTLAKYKAPVVMTLLTAVGKRERFTDLAADDSETSASSGPSLAFTITNAATGSAAIKGRPYF